MFRTLDDTIMVAPQIGVDAAGLVRPRVVDRANLALGHGGAAAAR